MSNRIDTEVFVKLLDEQRKWNAISREAILTRDLQTYNSAMLKWEECQVKINKILKS